MENKLVKKVTLADQEVDVANIGKYETRKLIEMAAAKDRKIKGTVVELDFIKSELQSRAENEIEEKNIKFTEFYGEKNSYVGVTVAQALEVLNMIKLKELLGAELIVDKIKIKPADIKYEYDKKFKQALIAVVTGDYDREFTVEQVVDSAGWEIDGKQKSLLLKKLKGEYKKDRKAVLSILGKQENEIDVDVELYYIYKIKNWELIKAYFDTEKEFEILAEEIKKYVTVDETPKIELKYS